jgi:tryptophan synthase alpha chain
VNRLDKVFSELMNKKEGALMAYIPVMDRELTYSLEVADMFVEAGVDIIQVGLPTEFPWMDGNIIQKYHKYAISQGFGLDLALNLVQLIRERYPLKPLVPMAFYSEVWAYGIEDFVKHLIESEVDAVDSPDYPYFYLQDKHEYRKRLEEKGIYCINPIDDDTVKRYETENSFQRMLLFDFIKNSKGFIFLMATPGGISGAFGKVKWEGIKEASEKLDQVMKNNGKKIPVLAVCGISNPKEVFEILNNTKVNGVMVGSAIVRKILQKEKLEQIERDVKNFKLATIIK